MALRGSAQLSDSNSENPRVRQAPNAEAPSQAAA